MFWTPLTEEEMTRVINFIENDDTSVMDTDIPQRLVGLCSALQKKIFDTLKAEKKENAKLARKLQQQVVRDNAAIENGDFKDLAFDSVDIANALIYCIRLKDGRVTKTKVMCILYEIYAAWLATHKERIFIEHPVAYEYGPWLWRVAGKITNFYGPMDKSVLDRIYERNKGVAVLIKRAADKYFDHNEKDLQKYLLKSVPYKKASKENNGGKWNKEISDTDIYHWKNEQYGK